MFRTKIQQKYLNKICTKAVLRKSNIYRKTMHLNTCDTNMKIMIIKTNKDFFDHVVSKKNWDDNLVFLWRKKTELSTYLFKSEVDIIVCDSYFKVINLIKNVQPNSNLNLPEKSFNIWIGKIGIIDFFKIELNDYLSTVPLVKK